MATGVENVKTLDDSARGQACLVSIWAATRRVERNTIFPAFAALIFACSCASTQDRPASGYDRFNGITIHTTALTPPIPSWNPVLKLNLRQEVSDEGATNYSLVTTYINPIGSMLLLADGQRLGFDHSFLVQNAVDGWHSYFRSSESELRILANSTNLEGRFIGSGTLEQRIPSKDIQAYRDYVAAFLP